MVTTPSGLSVAEAEELSRKQQQDKLAGLPAEGSYFQMPAGEGANKLYQMRGGSIVGLGFNFPKDWQGMTIGNWLSQQTSAGLAAIGGSAPVMNAADIYGLIREGRLSQGADINDVDEFISSSKKYIPTESNILTPETPKPSGTLAAASTEEKQLNTSLVDIWDSRSDLQRAFPQGTQAGTSDNAKLNAWWESNGKGEYPNTTLVAPGSPLVTAPKTIEEQQGIPRPTTPTGNEVLDNYNQQITTGDTSSNEFVNKETLDDGRVVGYRADGSWRIITGDEGKNLSEKGAGDGGGDGDSGGGGDGGDGGDDTELVDISNKEFLDYLTSIGIDPNQVTQDNLLLASIAYESMKTLEQTGQVVDPELEITEEHASAFLAELEKNPLVNKKFYEFAQTELGPYYQQKIDFAKQDLGRELEDIKRQYGEGIEDIGEQTAETGLAFSGIRKKQETELAGSATRLAGGLGRTAERQYGSSALAGFTSPTIGTTPLYQLSGGITGELEKEQEVQSKLYAQNIESVYRQRKAGQEYI